MITLNNNMYKFIQVTKSSLYKKIIMYKVKNVKGIVKKCY